jgi:arsenate reductase
VRSQLAEAIFRHFGNSKLEVKSAGSNPCGVNPNVYKVLDEVGIDSRGLYSKNAMDFINERFDYVITVCDVMRQNCPAFPGEQSRIHYSIEDPGLVQGTEEEILSAFRNTRNIIKVLTIGFLNIPLDKAKLKCPFCSFIQEIEIPEDKYLAFHSCPKCGEMIFTPGGSCCVICGYSDKVCRKFYEQVMSKYHDI